ncbi:MAG TPA: aminoacyl-tRNA hydrolase [Patescibacteria group bacterium]|nr:aminoacyl-tRNA hydrolase [Patescibacteria group bacterium]
MKIIVGLGNPGQEYSATRHNVGFMAADVLAERWQAPAWRDRFDAWVTECRLETEVVYLMKPQTYMNLSGVAVNGLLRFYKVDVSDVIVIYDDLDLAVGRLRLRAKGGSGGHRGIESLLVHLGKDEFSRVRIGIGRPPAGWETANYVLSRFNTEEAPLVRDAVNQAAEAAEMIVRQGLVKAMNQFNTGEKKKG